MINCDNKQCIYNERNKCTLKEINITVQSMCDDCTEPEINEEIIQKAKKETLSRMLFENTKE